MNTIYSIIRYLLLLFIVTGISTCQKDNPLLLSLTEEIDLIAEQNLKVGMAVGVIGPEGMNQEFFYGVKEKETTDSIDENTIFEIGSITKTFTGALLGTFILNGQLDLNEPVEKYLPADSVTMPHYNETKITFEHLATHTSGLPRTTLNYPVPDGFDPANQYAEYTREDIYDFLTNYCELIFEPGTKFEYSNLGVGLLGHILGRINNSGYEILLQEKMLAPLGMENTILYMTPNALMNCSKAYDQNLNMVDYYTANDIYLGMGFIKSSLSDMLKYLEACMGIRHTSVNNALALAQQPHYRVGEVSFNDRIGIYDLSIGLTWEIEKNEQGHTITYHGGRTNGSMAYIGMEKSKSVGIVVLLNHSEPEKIISLGEQFMFALLNHI